MMTEPENRAVHVAVRLVRAREQLRMLSDLIARALEDCWDMADDPDEAPTELVAAVHWLDAEVERLTDRLVEVTEVRP